MFIDVSTGFQIIFHTVVLVEMLAEAAFFELVRLSRASERKYSCYIALNLAICVDLK